MKKISVAMITHGNRYNLVRESVSALLGDVYLDKIIVVDNASSTGEELSEFCKKESKIILIKNEKNYGSSGGFAMAIKKSRELDSDFLLLLDDDCVLEKGGLEKFLNIKKEYFENQDVVLLANRYNVGDNANIFFTDKIVEKVVDRNFFSLFSFKKLSYYLTILLKYKASKENLFYIPILPRSSFAFGGAFIPMKAIKEAPLPDSRLFLYGDDIEYSWGIVRLEYAIYACSSPLLKDIDNTYPGGDYLSGLFLKTTPDSRVYFRIRNAALISMKYAKGFNIYILVINIMCWFILLVTYAIFKVGLSKEFFSKTKVILKSLIDGVNMKYEVPKQFMPENSEVIKIHDH